MVLFFFQAEDGIRDYKVTGVQTCALPICPRRVHAMSEPPSPPLVELRGVAKSYGGVHALSDVGFAIEGGTVHALVGEKIGRASCREREWEAVGDVALKSKRQRESNVETTR